MTTNEYFDYKADVSRIPDGVVARAYLWNRLYDLITEAFDMLPEVSWFDSVSTSLESIAAGSGVVVSTNDANTGTLMSKITSTDGSVDLEEVDDGSDESLDLSVDTDSMNMFHTLF